MDKKSLLCAIDLYKRERENNNVDYIEFHYKDDQTSTVDDGELINQLLSTLIIALESEQHKMIIKENGEYPVNLETTPEYKVAMQLGRDLNTCCFSNKNFVESIPRIHRTIQQNMFRLFRDCFLYLASLEERCIDDRNRGSYETAKKIADILKESRMPFI